MKIQSSPRKGFTLIELLTVIAIIGILASILFPAIGAVRGIAQKAAAQSNCTSVAKSYSTYAAGTPNGRNIRSQGSGTNSGVSAGVASNINDVAFILAQKGSLNDARIWFIAQDPQLDTGALPQVVILGDISTATNVSPDFSAAKPKGWAFAVGVPVAAATSTTPLLWTYGLESNGKWSKTSPWEGKGGHIGFLDTHTVWYEQLDSSVPDQALQTYQSNSNGGQPTNNIKDALPQNGRVVIVNEMGKD